MIAPISRSQRLVWLAPWAALLLFAFVLLRTAWLSDDAYITFRTVRNFVEGDGLRWNLAERVQSFTHPLWLFLLSGAYALTREIYFTSLAVSLLVSLAVGWLVVTRATPSRVAGACTLLLLASSRAFVDFSTSGLENPLSHLLLVVFLVLYLRLGEAAPPRVLLRLALVAALGTVARLDNLLLFAPMLAAAWWRGRSLRGALALAAGFLPLVAWEAFSLVYYGALIPNTAYAKLPAALSGLALAQQGLSYLGTCALLDRVLALVVLAGLAAPLVFRRRDLLPLSAGILLNLIYVVKVGGDFMAGRFLTASFLVAAIAVAHAVPWSARRSWLAIGLVPVALSLTLGLASPLAAGPGFGQDWDIRSRRSGVGDERAFYFRFTGLLRKDGAFQEPRHAWFEVGRAMKPGTVTTCVTCGFTGWAAPRDTWIVDVMALTDPLLSRLPLQDPGRWRIGHFVRAIPPGYLETLRGGTNLIKDPKLAALYDDLQLLARGPIWSGARWRAIWRRNSP